VHLSGDKEEDELGVPGEERAEVCRHVEHHARLGVRPLWPAGRRPRQCLPPFLPPPPRCDQAHGVQLCRKFAPSATTSAAHQVCLPTLGDSAARAETYTSSRAGVWLTCKRWRGGQAQVGGRTRIPAGG